MIERMVHARGVVWVRWQTLWYDSGGVLCFSGKVRGMEDVNFNFAC